MQTTRKDRLSLKTLGVLASGLGLFWGTSALAQAPGIPPAPAVGDEPGYHALEETLNGHEATIGDGQNGACNQVDCALVEEEPDCDHLMKCFDDDCGNNWMADRGLRIYGWLDQGFTWNPDSPRNRSNGLVVFNDRANEYQMNQLYLVFERAIDTTADEWQVGGRMDLLYGTDYYFTQALGLETEQDGTQRWNRQDGPTRAFGPNTGAMYGLAMPQLYAEVGGNDLSVKLGHFYTIIAYEVVAATGNFFYSHANTHQYAEPFTHTGVLTGYNLSDNVLMYNGIVQGWDNWDNTNSGVSYLGGVTFTNDDETASLALAVITGDERTSLAPKHFENRTMYSVVLSLQPTENLTYVFEHDNGYQDDAFGPNSADAEWYSVTNYLFYDLTDNVRAGVRGEWFRDDDGFRVPAGGGVASHYYEITAGLNWTPIDCVTVRPEIRWDKADGATPFNDFTDDEQFLFAADMIWQF